MNEMHVLVRNTFLHLRHNSSDDVEESRRSSSAPPACRQGSHCDGDCDVASTSTRCKTERTKSSSFGDVDVEDNFPPTPNCEDDDSSFHGASNEGDSEENVTHQLSPVEAQQQIEQMSLAVMEMWARVRAAEKMICASTSITAPGAISWASAPAVPWASTPAVPFTPHWTTDAASKQCEEVLQLLVGKQQAPTGAAWSNGLRNTPMKTKLKAAGSFVPLLTPSGKPFGDAHDCLASVKQLLMLASGVTGVDVQAGSEGTLTILSIQHDPSESTIGSVIAASKLVLLEAAANSETVYVMGYESEPFKDMGDTTFVTMLASMPIAWQRFACWETYRKGTCPRGRACKWKHPGNRELQPVRVVVS